MSDGSDTLFVDSPEALQDLCGRLRGHDWLALDTEFHREDTYRPRLCLVQVATPGLTACIDPLALDDLDPLLDMLYDPCVLKVLHAARQDLEIFHYLRGTPFTPVFDTQMAAPLLGYPDQAGFGNLVAAVLGVRLAKAHARADWRRRPLPSAQLRYAADDVRYLAPLYERLRAGLDEHGRLGWLEADFAALSDPQRYEMQPEQAWRRLRGAERLRGSSLSVLQRLAAWREQAASAEDRPRGWLLKDEVLFDLARMMPDAEQELRHVRGLGDAVIRRHGPAILATIRAARDRPPEPVPARRAGRRLSAEEDALVDLLSAVVRLRATEQHLSAAVLAPRAEVERLVAGDPGTLLLTGWRRGLIGEELGRVLRGEHALRVDGGALRVEPATA